MHGETRPLASTSYFAENFVLILTSSSLTQVRTGRCGWVLGIEPCNFTVLDRLSLKLLATRIAASILVD